MLQSSKVLSGVKRFILWDYPRASWQYDVMVGLILMFVFLTPRAWFRDQPRIPMWEEVAVQLFWIEPELVAPWAEKEREIKLSAILKSRYGKPQTVTRLEPIYDSEKVIIGYMAFTK